MRTYCQRLRMLAILVALAPSPLLAQEWDVVRLGFSAGLDALPAVVAEERGFFAEEHLIVSGLAVGSPDATARSLAAGTTDFAAVPQRALLLMAAAELPVTVLALNGWDSQLDLVIPAGAEAVTSLGDLAGQRILVDDASDAPAVLVRLLNLAGVRPGDVEIGIAPAAALASALQEGGAAAVLAPRLHVAPLVQAGAARPLLTHEAMVAELGLRSARPLLVRADLKAENPQLVQRFVNAWVKALAYMRQDPEDAASLFQVFLHRQGIGVARPVAAAWLGTSRYDRVAWSAEDVADAEYNGWALAEAQLLPHAPRLAALIEPGFAERAWQRLQ